ncbi:MAG: Bug family tripartite tricarboxylate transporter substrate binding protein [Pigmentiphaga sp.]
MRYKMGGLLATLFIGVALNSPAQAGQNFPSKPITIVVPFAPGGGADILARLISQDVAKNLEVPVLVENRPGGGTLIAAQAVARAKPDGYTVLTAVSATMVMNPHLYTDLPYDPKKDFAPVTLASSMPMVIAVNPEFPVKSLKELTDHIQRNPGELSYAYGATGGQIVGELYRDRAGLDVQGIAYNGSTPAQNDVVGGHLPIIVDALTPALSLLKSGRLRPLAVSSAERAAVLPDVPSLEEEGLQGIDVGGWTGFAVPAGTPQQVIDRLHEAFHTALSAPEIRSKLESLGQTVYASDGEAFRARIDRDYDLFGEVIRSAGIEIR